MQGTHHELIRGRCGAAGGRTVHLRSLRPLATVKRKCGLRRCYAANDRRNASVARSQPRLVRLSIPKVYQSMLKDARLRT